VEGDGGTQVLQNFGKKNSIISSFSNIEMIFKLFKEEDDNDNDSFNEDLESMMLLTIYESIANDVDFAKVATSISRDKLLVEQDEIKNKLLA